jgi:transcription antitermination factor NusG
MAKRAVKNSQVLILSGPYEGEMATVERVDRRGDIWAKINRGSDAGEKAMVKFGHYKVVA